MGDTDVSGRLIEGLLRVEAHRSDSGNVAVAVDLPDGIYGEGLCPATSIDAKLLLSGKTVSYDKADSRMVVALKSRPL